MSLQALKKLNLDAVIEMEEAIALSAYARTLEAEYAELDMLAPEWISKASETLREEIARRSHAADMAELKRLQGEIDGYKTASEKRAEAQNRLAAMQKKLGLATAKTRA